MEATALEGTFTGPETSQNVDGNSNKLEIVYLGSTVKKWTLTCNCTIGELNSHAEQRKSLFTISQLEIEKDRHYIPTIDCDIYPVPQSKRHWKQGCDVT